jgi:hypothetical protein
MNPKPLAALKNFTVPMVMIVPFNHRVPLLRNTGTAVETRTSDRQEVFRFVRRASV